MVDLRRWDWQAGKLVNDPLPEDPLPEREEQEAKPAREEEEDYGWRPWD